LPFDTHQRYQKTRRGTDERKTRRGTDEKTRRGTDDPAPMTRWSQIYSTNPLERLNAEIKRRTNVVGIFPNDASITRLVGAMMLEQNDEWSLNRRYMQLEGLQTLTDTVSTRLSAVPR
jgi:transposase-like protein